MRMKSGHAPQNHAAISIREQRQAQQQQKGGWDYCCFVGFQQQHQQYCYMSTDGQQRKEVNRRPGLW